MPQCKYTCFGTKSYATGQRIVYTNQIDQLWFSASALASGAGLLTGRLNFHLRPTVARSRFLVLPCLHNRIDYVYQPDTWRDGPVIQLLTELADRYTLYGLRSCSGCSAIMF